MSLLGEEVLLELDAELLAQGLELVEVLLVLGLVLNLGLDTCKLKWDDARVVSFQSFPVLARVAL